MENIELVESFFSSNALRIPPKFYRIGLSGSRYYINDSADIKIGITSFLSKVLPMNVGLQKWQQELGEKEAKRILYERAHYGTLLHLIIADILRNYVAFNEYRIPLMVQDIKETIILHGEESSNIEAYELQKDLAAFAAFCEQHKPIPILIESPLGSNSMPLAATLDFFGTIETEIKGFFGETYKSGEKKGEPKETKQIERIHAIIDFKSMIKKESKEDKTKPIGLSNKFQLNYQRLFLRETFPEFIETDIKMFNCVPKNWRTKPECQLTEIEDIEPKILEAQYLVSKVTCPSVIDKVSERNVFNYAKYNGSIAESVKKIEFKQYCKQLIFEKGL